jgi:hypothetical protein
MSRYRHHGFVAALPKPYNISEVARVLQRLLGRR